MESLLRKKILEIHPGLLENGLDEGLQLFEVFEHQAKDIVLKHGDVATHLFFCETSISRCYYFDENNDEQTLWMKPEHQFITEFKSFVGKQPSQFNLQFYEKGKAYRISRNDLESLYQKYPEWSIWGLKLTESLHVTLIDVFVNLLANDATRNYQYIEYAFPRFIQVAPLKDIASMLQISQVSLSRIRAGNQTIQ